MRTLDGERAARHNCKMRMGNTVWGGHKSPQFSGARQTLLRWRLWSAPQEPGADAQRSDEVLRVKQLLQKTRTIEV